MPYQCAGLRDILFGFRLYGYRIFGMEEIRAGKRQARIRVASESAIGPTPARCQEAPEAEGPNPGLGIS
jgi:hypothetical protein